MPANFTTKVEKTSPRPGDVIRIGFSTWYGVENNSDVFVCEKSNAFGDTVDFCIVPKGKCSVFWGPNFQGIDDEPPFDLDPDDIGNYMSTSGGPFMGCSMEQNIPHLCKVGKTDMSFWSWKDSPRMDGGIQRTERRDYWYAPLLIEGKHLAHQLEHFRMNGHLRAV